MSSPDLPGQSATHPPHRSLPDPNRIARSSWLLTRLFPDFSQIFLHTLLESRDFDLLSTLETLVDLLQNGTLAPFPGVVPSIRFYPGIHNAFNPRVLAHLALTAYFDLPLDLRNGKSLKVMNGLLKGSGVGWATNPIYKPTFCSHPSLLPCAPDPTPSAQIQCSNSISRASNPIFPMKKGQIPVPI